MQKVLTLKDPYHVRRVSEHTKSWSNEPNERIQFDEIPRGEGCRTVPIGPKHR